MTSATTTTASADHGAGNKESVAPGDRVVLVVPPHSVGPAASLNLLGLLDLRIQTWSYAAPAPSIWRRGDCSADPRQYSGFGRYYYFSPGGGISGGYRGYGSYGGSYGGGYSTGGVSQQPGGRLWQNWAPRSDGTYTVTHHYDGQ